MRGMRAWLALCGVIAATGMLAPAALADPDVVGEWHLDQLTGNGNTFTTPDATPNGNALSGFAEQVSDGRFGAAVHFNAQGSLSVVAQTGALEPAPAITVLAWVRAAQPP